MKINQLQVTIGLFVLVFLLIYAPTYSTPYIMDDSHTIQSNQFVQSLKHFGFSWVSAKAYSSSPENYGYRPVTINFSQLCWFLGDGRVAAFQIAKKLLLVVFAFLCFLLWNEWQTVMQTNRKSDFWWGSGGMAFGFFLLHPVATQVGNYIAASSTLLCSLFYVLAFLFYLKFRRLNQMLFLVLAGISYFLAVMSKEEGITLIAILFLTEIFFLRRNAQVKASQKMAWLSMLAMGLIAVLSVYMVVLHFEPTSNIARGSVSRALYFATQWRAYIYYLSTYLWPVQFNFDNFSFQFATEVWTGTNILFLTINSFIVGVGVYLCYRRQEIGLAILGFYIAIAPASSIIPLAESVNDHRHFIPFIFFGFGMIQMVDFVFTKWIKRPKVQAYFVAGLLVFYSTATLVRNFDFSTGRSLWTDTVLKNPESPRAKNNLALDYMAVADYDFAQRLLSRCVADAIYYYPCFINYAVTSAATGDNLTAEEYFKKAIPMDSNLVSSRLFFADFLEKQGRYGEAEKYLAEANLFTNGLNKPVMDRLNTVRAKQAAAQ
ncbi:MAG: hypothetical protein H7235_02260 [Bdellovibrionaceae bacterium]|nr:hypothetical protein [Pseudobdellovibrionaceae bacterium]